MPLKRKIVVATHHKTGTLWMKRTFDKLSSSLGLTFCDVDMDGLNAEADVLFDQHSNFAATYSGDFRGLHLIRDPRDVVISAMHYHRESAEEWLHLPRDDFGGLTYQQKLNSLDPEDQFVLEMTTFSRRTIEQMLEWRYDQERFYEAKYERLIVDVGAIEFGKILNFLGVSGIDAFQGMAIFRAGSLFGPSPPRTRGHIRDGRKEQWRTFYRRHHGVLFLDTFGDALVRLGYEPDNAWVDRLPQ